MSLYKVSNVFRQNNFAYRHRLTLQLSRMMSDRRFFFSLKTECLLMPYKSNLRLKVNLDFVLSTYASCNALQFSSTHLLI